MFFQFKEIKQKNTNNIENIYKAKQQNNVSFLEKKNDISDKIPTRIRRQLRGHSF
jgi:hypothetical protein